MSWLTSRSRDPLVNVRFVHAPEGGFGMRGILHDYFADEGFSKGGWMARHMRGGGERTRWITKMKPQRPSTCNRDCCCRGHLWASVLPSSYPSSLRLRWDTETTPASRPLATRFSTRSTRHQRRIVLSGLEMFPVVVINVVAVRVQLPLTTQRLDYVARMKRGADG